MQMHVEYCLVRNKLQPSHFAMMSQDTLGNLASSLEWPVGAHLSTLRAYFRLRQKVLFTCSVSAGKSSPLKMLLQRGSWFCICTKIDSYYRLYPYIFAGVQQNVIYGISIL